MFFLKTYAAAGNHDFFERHAGILDFSEGHLSDLHTDFLRPNMSKKAQRHKCYNKQRVHNITVNLSLPFQRSNIQ